MSLNNYQTTHNQSHNQSWKKLDYEFIILISKMYKNWDVEINVNLFKSVIIIKKHNY